MGQLAARWNSSLQNRPIPLDSSRKLHTAHEYEYIWRILVKSIRRTGAIRPRTTTCPAFLAGYSFTVRILAPSFREGVRPQYENLPHAFEKVFVHGRILAPCFWEGIRPWTNICLMFLRGYSSVADEYIALSEANTMEKQVYLFEFLPKTKNKRLTHSINSTN